MKAVDGLEGLKNYEILRVIGRGGMGEVFLARDVRLQRLVAIKHIRRDLCDREWREQLSREAQLLSRLNHPNVVQIHDILDCDGSPALVMQYVDGHNLHVQLRERQSDLSELLRWLSEIAAGLSAAHDAGIAHNDLKAENVLIGSDNIARVTDFGIASADLDLHGDIAALGKLAGKLLHDHSDISPGLKCLLQELTDSNPSRRPTGQVAAQRLREAWLESTQEETALPVLDTPEPVQQKRYRVVSGLVLAAIAAALTFFLLTHKTVQRNYVAVLPTLIEGEDLSGQQQLNIRSTVQQALQQGVMATRELALVSLREVDIGSRKPAEIAQILGADELVGSFLKCSQTSCELTIDRLGGDDLAVLEQRSTSVFPDSNLETYSIVQRQWHWLYPESADAQDARELISDEAFREYLDLYQSSSIGSGVQVETFARLEALLGKANRFLPLYDLYTQSALEMHDESGDASYLDKLQAALTQAEFRTGKSRLLGKCWFDLAIARKDYTAAVREIDEVGELGGDEVLINKMRGDLYFEQSRHERAGGYYGTVLELKPSRAAYYRVAHNLYNWGKPERAMDVLEKSLGLYPDDIEVLGLMGMIYLERGELEQAVVRFEQSLAIQPHAIYYNDLGLAYMLSGDYARARDVFQRNSDLGNRRPLYLLNLAGSEALMGSEETADRLYRELIALGSVPGAVDLWIISQAYAQLGLFEQAIATLKRIESEGIERSDAAFNAALVYTLAGQDIAALVEIDHALNANFGAIWFALPWFDRLCKEPNFSGLLSQAGFPDRCGNTAIL